MQCLAQQANLSLCVLYNCCCGTTELGHKPRSRCSRNRQTDPHAESQRDTL